MHFVHCTINTLCTILSTRKPGKTDSVHVFSMIRKSTNTMHCYYVDKVDKSVEKVFTSENSDIFSTKICGNKWIIALIYSRG